MMDHLGITFLFDKGCDVFDRSPAGNMPVLSFPENAIEQTCSTEQSHVTTM